MSDDATLDEFTNTPDNESSESEEKESRFWGEIPTDWNLANGSDIYDVNPNPDPIQQPNTYIEMDAVNTELPFPDYFGERNASEYSGKTFTQGDTLFARITPCTENGKAALVPEIETKVGIGSTEFAVLSPKSDIIHPWFLYYLNKSHPVHNYAVSRMRGSTGRQRVPFSVFRKELDFPLPPLSEQRKIATVLHTVDQAIQKIEDVIRSLQRILRGTRRDVMKNGVHTHQMSDSDSRFGDVPEVWEIERLDSVTDVTGGSTPSTDESKYWSGEIPWATPTDLTGLDEIKIRDTESHITEEGLNSTSTNLLPPESVLMTSRATIGECAVNTVEMATNQGFQSLVPDESVDTWYIYYRMEEEANYLNSLGSGSTFSEVSNTTVQRVKIPIPPIEEQEQIADILKSIDEASIQEEEYKTQLQQLKRGLMQDLLSGTVRTADANVEIPDKIEQYG